MIVHREDFFIIGYGDLYSSFSNEDIPRYQEMCASSILSLEPFNQFAELMELEHFAKSKQEHGIAGLIIDEAHQAPAPFTFQADYLITDKPGIGLAISSADCLPVMFYDQENQVVAIAHAGWQGVAGNIVSNVIHDLQRLYGTQPEKLRVFFGPGAGVCCYEVGKDTLEHFKKFPFFEAIIHREDAKTFLDITECVLLQLQECGVPRSVCESTYNNCTICMTHYASHRRLKNPQRQLTVIMLKK